MRKNSVNKSGSAYQPTSTPKVVQKDIQSVAKRGTTSPYSLSINCTSKNNKKQTLRYQERRKHIIPAPIARSMTVEENFQRTLKFFRKSGCSNSLQSLDLRSGNLIDDFRMTMDDGRFQSTVIGYQSSGGQFFIKT